MLAIRAAWDSSWLAVSTPGAGLLSGVAGVCTGTDYDSRGRMGWLAQQDRVQLPAASGASLKRRAFSGHQISKWLARTRVFPSRFR